MRVAVVIDGLAPGGAEQLLVTFAEAARDQGLELHVISLKPATDSPIAASIRAAGARVETLGLRRLVDPRAVLALRRRLRALRPGVVHSHLMYADILAALATPRGIPLISTLHVVQTDAGRHGRLKDSLAAATRRIRAARIIAVSEAAGAWYRAAHPIGRGQLVVIPNGVLAPPPGRRPADVRAELGIPEDARVVTMVGVMRPGKGHEAAVRAFAALDPTTRAVLVLAGDGPERAAVAGIAAASGADVRFLGHRTDIADLLRASDVFTLPSEGEALPTVVMEAMSAGLPVVATRVGGIPELVEDGLTGILVETGDTAALSAALARVIDDRELAARLGGAGADRYAREFTAGRWAQRMRATYDEVVGAAS